MNDRRSSGLGSDVWTTLIAPFGLGAAFFCAIGSPWRKSFGLRTRLLAPNIGWLRRRRNLPYLADK
ncbi:MAG: hypothetical protein SGJ09_15660, partial [Phycisphaerae bacterium]|nr:hypothetical protein [Phycisphaerae bacterium]